MHDEPARQIHLDFHTSEYLPEIGGRFSREQFQTALQTGRVNLINLFAKCHHSWSYYPTKIGIPHPNLKIDLLGEQIEACHQIGVKAPIYYTVGWSAHDAETHPEWCVRTITGEIATTGRWDTAGAPETPKPTFQWKHLCPSGEYHELVKAQTEEICRSYPTDGLWFDIYQPHVPCYCEHCRAGMSKANLNPDVYEDVEKFRAMTILSHCEELVGLIKGLHPNASIYFNGMTTLDRPENRKYNLFQWNTKNDLEDLPTTWGGYDKFPLRSKMFLLENKPIVAMSGKFHTAWGEFGGFKDPEALRFEAASMIAFGARCNIGDQLHPSGLMDMSTYRNIGHAYEYVEKIEHLGVDGESAASLGFVFGNNHRADEGTVRMLLENQIDFQVVREGDDLTGFETLIIPSVPGVLDGMNAAFQAYLKQGGSALILGEGLLNSSGDTSLLPSAADNPEKSEYDMDFTTAAAEIGAGLPDSPFLNYSAALRLRPGAGAEILAAVQEPYFSRTYGKYCGHQNTPYKLETAPYPSVIKYNKTIITAHPLDRMYFAEGARVHRQLFINALRMLHRNPMVEADLPSAGRINLLHFPRRREYVLHLLYAPPLERGRCLLIEDMPPLNNVKVKLRLPVETAKASFEPAGIPLVPEFCGRMDNGSTCMSITIPPFSCHGAVRVRY